MRFRTLAMALSLFMAATGAALAQGDERSNRREMLDELFAPELYGTSLRWFGVIDATVFLDPTCVFEPGDGLGSQQRCVVLRPAPEETQWNELGIARLEFPGNTFKNVICPVFLQQLNYRLRNGTGAVQSGAMDFHGSITLESEALKDPGAVDPVSQAPLDGRLEVPWGRRLFARSFNPGEGQREILQYTRACNAGLSKANLLAMGLPSRVVERMFRQPLTIQLNIGGQARLAEFAVLSLAMRVMGN